MESANVNPSGFFLDASENPTSRESKKRSGKAGDGIEVPFFLQLSLYFSDSSL